MILKSARVLAHVRLCCKAGAYLRSRQVRKGAPKERTREHPESISAVLCRNPDTVHKFTELWSMLYYRQPASSEGTLSPRCRRSNKKQIDVTVGAGPDGYSEISRSPPRSIVRGC